MIQAHVNDANELGVLCGHGIAHTIDPTNPFAEKNWVLLDYQRGDPPFYREQMLRAIMWIANAVGALLVISGGQTRRGVNQRSESGSYLAILESVGWFGFESARQRTVIEDQATDSYQNIIFSIARYREVVGRYPEKISIFSWRFKERRFDLHRAAIKWPSSKYSFIGVGEPDAREAAAAGEAVVLAQFESDPYGVLPPLAQKRDERNPFRRHPGYALSCPEIAGLLQYSGVSLYPESLPWEE